MSNESAEADSREQMSDLDERRYKGVARHPLARKWMLKRLTEAKEKAVEARSGEESEAWIAKVKHLTAELSRCGVKLKEYR